MLLSYDSDNGFGGVLLGNLKKTVEISDDVRDALNKLKPEYIEIANNMQNVGKITGSTNAEYVNFLKGLKKGSITLNEEESYLDAYQRQLQNTGKGLDLATIKTKALSVSMKLLSSIGWMLAITAITEAIQILVTTLNNSVDSIENVEDRIKDNQSALSEYTSKIEELTNKLKELNDIDVSYFSEAEKKELELEKQYVESQLELYDKLAKAKEDAIGDDYIKASMGKNEKLAISKIISETKSNGIEGLVDSVTDVIKDDPLGAYLGTIGLGQNVFLKKTDDGNYLAEADDLIEKYKKLNDELVNLQNQAIKYGGNEVLTEKTDETASEMTQVSAEIAEAIEQIAEARDFLVNSEDSEQYAKEIEEMGKAIERYQEILDGNVHGSKYTGFDNLQRDLLGVRDVIKSLSNNLGDFLGIDLITDKINKLIVVIDLFKTYSLKELLGLFINQIKNDIEEFKTSFENGEIFENIKNKIKGMIPKEVLNGWKEFEEKIDSAKDKFKELFELISSSTFGTRIISLFENIGSAVQKITKPITDFIDKYGYIFKDAQKAWEDAHNVDYSAPSDEDDKQQNQTNGSLSEKIKNLWNSDDFANAKEKLEDLGKESEVTAEDIESLAKENEDLAKLLEESGMSAQFAAKCFTAMSRGNDSFSSIIEDALILDDVLHGMDGSLQKVAKSKSAYDKAMEQEDYNADFQSYQDAYATAMEMFASGDYGKQFRATMEYLLGEDSFTMSIDELYTAVSKLGTVFGESADDGYEFLDKLYANKDILDELDSSLVKLSDGTYDFDLKPEDFEEIADALGMTEESVAACVNALGMFGDYSSYDLDKLELAMNSISISAKDGEKSITSLQGVKNILKDLGYGGYEAYQILQQIQGMGSVELIDFETGNIDDTLSKLQKIQNVKIDGSQINLDSLITGMQNLGSSGTDISNFIDRLNGSFTLTDATGQMVSFDEAKKQALSVTTNEVNETMTQLGTESETTAQKVSTVGTEIDKVNQKSLNSVRIQAVNLSTVFGNVKQNVQQIIDKINTLNGMEVNVNNNSKTESETPKSKGYHGTVGSAFSKGTVDDIKNLPITGYNGLSKDEHNALRSEYGQPELTVYPNGTTELTTQPTMSDLPKGTIIFNEEQTKKIINNGNKKVGHAFASGTVKKKKYSGSDSSDSGNDKTEKDSKNLIDWIKRRLEVLQTKADRWAKIIENATDAKKITKYYDKLESVYKKQMKTNYDAASRYLSKTNSIKLSKDSKKNADLKNKIQSKHSSLFDKKGNLKPYKELLKKYGEETAEAINQYTDYYDKYQSCIDSYIEACENLYNAPIEEASAKIELLAKSLDVLDAKLDASTIDGYEDANKIIDQQVANQKEQEKANKSAYDTSKKNLSSAKKSVDSDKDLKKYNDLTKKERDKVLKAVKAGKEIDLTLFKEGSKGYKKALAYNAALQARNDAEQEYQISVEETKKIEREAEKQKFDNIQEYYEKQVELKQIEEDSIQRQVDLLEAKGMTVSAKMYQDQIDLEKQKQAQLQASADLLKEQLEEIPEGTKEWYEAKSALEDVNTEIEECDISIVEMNNSVTKLADDFQEKMAKVASTVRSTMDWAISLMSDMDTFDSDTGAMTKEGYATLGSYVSGYNNSSDVSENYRKQIAKFEEEYAKFEEYVNNGGKDAWSFIDENGQNRTYSSLDQMKEAIDGYYENWRNQISETHKYESQIIDMMRKKLESELKELKEIIENKKSALKAEKD